MQISDFSVKKPITVMMMTLAIAILGFVSLSQLGLDLLPKIEYPAITVVTSYPGIAPEEIETLLTKPIEDAVSTVKNVCIYCSGSFPNNDEMIDVRTCCVFKE